VIHPGLCAAFDGAIRYPKLLCTNYIYASFDILGASVIPPGQDENGSFQSAGIRLSGKSNTLDLIRESPRRAITDYKSHLLEHNGRMVG